MTPMVLTYVPWLVAISIAISIVASYAAFSFAERVAASKGARSRWWLAGGACSMGLGIWSMHYLGMLAVVLPVEVTYHVPTVLLSLLLAVAASAVTLDLVSRQEMGLARLGLGGVFMGAAIAGMHYTGMAAMRSAAMHHYNPAIVGLSVVVAVVFSWMALWIAFSVRKDYGTGEWRRLGGAVLMGSGIAAMHYTAMCAVTFTAGEMDFPTTDTVRVSTLDVVAVVLTTAVVLAGAQIAASLDRRMLLNLQWVHSQLTGAQADSIEREDALRKANSRLQALAVLDGLTGVYNRRYFDEVLAVEVARAARGSSSLSLLMIDVDYFKALNDRSGHLVGDRCLCDIAQAIAGRPLRGEDVLARWGGEEFAVLLPGTSEAGAFIVAETLRSAVGRLRIRNHDSPVSPFVTISIGIETRTPVVGESPEEMVFAADQALYRAKGQGRNRTLGRLVPAGRL